VAASKKKAPGTKPVARRFKVAVPERITIAFDTTRATWFNETTNAQLRGWKGSEHELVARACRLSGFTPDRIVHQGAQLLAQRLIATALSDAHLTVTRGGVRGAADERLAAGYKALKSAGLADADITASRLGYACTPKVNYRTATAWLANHGLPGAAKGTASAKATDDDRATIERLTAERVQIEAEIRVLSARLGLGTDPLPDTTAATSARATDPGKRPANAPQTAGTTPTNAKTITPASDAPAPGKAPKTRARKAPTAKAKTTRKTRGAA
jgi:hypothetical protein